MGKLGEKLDQALDDIELSINVDFFNAPRDLPILPKAQEVFAEWAEEIGNDSYEAQSIANRLPTYFVFRLHNQWRKNGAQYTEIYDQLHTPFSPDVEREIAWINYQSYLVKSVNMPMLDRQFSLADIHIWLRAYYLEKIIEGHPTEIDIQRSNREKKYKKHIFYLHEYLQDWIEQADKDSPLCLISGGPGSGKSSFAKMFAASQGTDKAYKTLFIPLHYFEFTGDISDAIGRNELLGEFFDSNPFELQKNERLLVIFDGLDELSMQGKQAAETARAFVDAVKEKLGRVNSQALKVQAIIHRCELSFW